MQLTSNLLQNRLAFQCTALCVLGFWLCAALPARQAQAQQAKIVVCNTGRVFAEMEESNRQNTDLDWLSSPRGAPRRRAGRRDGDLLYGEDRMSTVRGKGNARFQVVAGEVREVLEDLIFGHVGSQILQHFIDGNSQAAKTGFSAALIWVNGDVILVMRLGRH